MDPTNPSYHVDWILTTPSSAHLATDLSWFATYTPFCSCIGNPYAPSTNLAVHGVGTVHLPVRTSITDPNASEFLELKNVLYIPSGLGVNVVSMSLLHKEGWSETIPKGTRSGVGKLRRSEVELLLATPGRTKLWLLGSEKEWTVLEGEAEREALAQVECCWTEAERDRWEEYRREVGEGEEAGGWTGCTEGVVGNEPLRTESQVGNVILTSRADRDTDANEQTPRAFADNLPDHTNSHDSVPSLTDCEFEWVELYCEGLEKFLASFSLTSSDQGDLNAGLITLRERIREFKAEMGENDVADEGDVDHADGDEDGSTKQGDGKEALSGAEDGYLSAVHDGASAGDTIGPTNEVEGPLLESITMRELIWMKTSYGSGANFFAVHELWSRTQWVEALVILREEMLE